MTLNLVENGLRNALIAFGQAFKFAPASFFWLNGCTVSIVGLDQIFTDGYVLYLGEVYKVTGGTFPAVDDIYIDFDETNDPNGLKTFEDLAVLNTYKIRAARLTNVYGGSFLTLDDAKPFDEAIGSMVTNDSGGHMSYFIHQCMIPAAWITASAYTSPWTGTVEYRSLFSNEVALRGYITIASYAPNVLALTLPIGFRPAVTNVFEVLDTSGTAREIQILTNGRINVYGPIGVPIQLHLNSIRFFID